MQNVYLAPNGQPSNLTEEQWHLVRTKAFKDWFGDWENEPENASKIVDANGEPKVMYHQTTTETKNVLLEKGIFQKGFELAAKNDKDTPYGFYFKSSDKDIGLRGKEQMAFFLNARNPLTFRSRYYINTYFNGVTDEFWRLNTQYRETDMSYKKEFDENFKKTFDRKDEKAYQEWDNKIENILAEWRASVDDISVRLKEIITNYMLESEYDCMIIELDEGSMGRSTDTAIVFYSNQIKLADGSNTTFDGSNPDIRFEAGGVLDSLNPTGSIFVEYTPELRDKMPLAPNITTYDKTAGIPPHEQITVYRGATSGNTEIVSGDFITTNKQLAKDYAGTGVVLSRTVRADEILDDLEEPLGEEYILRLNRSYAEGGLIHSLKRIMPKTILKASDIPF